MTASRSRWTVGLVLLAGCILAGPAPAQQLTAGPNSPGASFNDVSFGTASWTNPANALASDDASAVAAPGGGSTHYLHANNFNLNIPASAVIDGIEVAVEKRSSVGTVLDSRVRIVKNGMVGATDLSDGAFWPTTDTVVTYGGPSELWGETWTAADVNASGFGVAISATDNVDTAAIDHISVKVYYSLCSAAPRTGCRTADKSLFLLRDNADDLKDRLVWKLVNAQATSQTELADPTATTVYATCIYANGALLDGAIVPPSGTLWKPISTVGFKYRDKTGAADGIQTIILRGSAEDRTKVIVKGKGGALPDPTPPFTLPVVVQLVNSDSGLCWEGTYDDPNIKKNVAGQFKGKF